MSKTKIFLVQIPICLALGTVLGMAFWFFDGGKTHKKDADCSGKLSGTQEMVWEFLRWYHKNDIKTSQWQHKETGEIREVLGMQPPMANLTIKKNESRFIIPNSCWKLGIPPGEKNDN